jgi:subtilisin family serine protease
VIVSAITNSTFNNTPESNIIVNLTELTELNINQSNVAFEFERNNETINISKEAINETNIYLGEINQTEINLPDEIQVNETSVLNEILNNETIEKLNETLYNISYMQLKDKLPAILLNKLHKNLWNLTEQNKLKIILQLKANSKSKVKENLKKGMTYFSFDANLLFAEVKGDEIEELANDSDVIKIWPDLETQSFLNESAYQVNADYLWNLNITGSGIKIAVLDTGINADHEMLLGRVIVQQDFTYSGDYDDYYGHGTHVAGIAAGNGYYRGIVYEAFLYNGKVLDDSGYGQLSWLINGIDWAIQNDADVISLSLGAVYSGSPEDQLDSPEVLKVQEAIDNSIIVVIAAGNCGSGYCGSFDSVTTPGIAKNAITVGAVDRDNNWASFSSGDYISDYIKPDIVAPGVSICSSVPNGYHCYSGTSMATPFVSGAAALILEANNTLTPSQIKEKLERNALDLGIEGKDIYYGSGLLNLIGIINVSVSNETVPEEDYSLNIPLFIVGETNNVKLEYFNICEEKLIKRKSKITNASINETIDECLPKRITVAFSVEELGDSVSYSETKSIKRDSSEAFYFSFAPHVPGKHKLSITVSDKDEILESISSSITAEVENMQVMESVRLVVR